MIYFMYYSALFLDQMNDENKSVSNDNSRESSLDMQVEIPLMESVSLSPMDFTTLLNYQLSEYDTVNASGISNYYK